MKLLNRLLPLTAALAALAAPAFGDPCGLVPPQGLPSPIANSLTRTGVQYTYVFFKDGIEDVVLRPAFTGKVSEFGMLIPFKSPPEIRKVSDDIFGQLEASVTPQAVFARLNPPPNPTGPTGPSSGPTGPSAPTTPTTPTSASRELRYDAVRVVNQEAMGMYQVAVLEAGSPKALKKWMTTHGYAYPEGMEEVVRDYVAKRWCFVAVKAKVGPKSGVSPRPGMRSTNPNLPAGAVFSGAVQAMGFRFRTNQPVVPMRLSAHNPGKLHNRVFALAETGVRFQQLSKVYVRQQVSGKKLAANVSLPLPATVQYWRTDGRMVSVTLGVGEEPSLPNTVLPAYQRWATDGRDPKQQSGQARDLFLSDLLSAKTGRLLHHFETRHKALLNLGEQMGVRGPHLDQLIEHELAEIREQVLREMHGALQNMTLTIIDGEFPREILRDDDLTMFGYDAATGIDSASPSNGSPRAEGDSDDDTPEKKQVSTGGLDPMFDLWDRSATLEQRGAALLAVIDRGDRSDWARLRRVVEDKKERPLVRFLAVAAMGKVKPKETTSLLMAGATGQFGAEPWNWNRPTNRWGWGPQAPAGPRGPTGPTMPGRSQPAPPPAPQSVAAKMSRALQGHVTADLARRAPERLVVAMLTEPNQGLRRLAAGYIADTQLGRTAVLDALAFDRAQAERAGVPWKGGPLFLPGVNYSQDEAATLVRDLLRWALWLEGPSGRSQANNNTRVLRNNILPLVRRYGVLPNQRLSSSWPGVAVAWSKQWADRGRRADAAELLVDALQSYRVQRRDVYAELTRLAGEDRGKSFKAWQNWLKELRGGSGGGK